ncbi:Nepenthesin [Bertholletia excelsa]
MAEKFCLFLLAFSLYLQFASPHATTVFDVSASIQRTLDVLSFDPNTLNSKDEEKLAQSSSSSAQYSVSVHPRSSLQKSQHRDYEELTRSRLQRDSARVKAIGARLELALNGVNRSAFRPVDEEKFRPEGLQSPLTSGVRLGSGEYFSRIGVGRPAKPYYMVIDTGSDINWLQCEPCSDCYQQSDPVFLPSQSSTYRSLSCKSPQCSALQISACRVDSCLYQVSYGDGSFTVGEFATETLSFGNSGTANGVALGCGHDNEGLFAAAAGLLGLGGGSLSLPSQIKASSFSYCLVDRDSSSSSTLEFNSPRPGDSITAPLLRNNRVRTYLYVGITGISVGGRPLNIPESVFAVDASGRGGIIVDSGTAVTRLKTEAYNSLRDTFASLTRNLPSSSGFAIFDKCYDLSSMQKIAVPTVSFRFAGGGTLRLRPENYLIPVDSSGKFCLAFAPTDGQLSIVGNIQQQGTRVSYDLAHSLVGFSPNKC